MRWGVPLQARDDHSTVQLCLDEIRHSQQQSLGPNFVVSNLILKLFNTVQMDWWMHGWMDNGWVESTKESTNEQIDGLMQERRNSSALAMELCLSCIDPSKWTHHNYKLKPKPFRPSDAIWRHRTGSTSTRVIDWCCHYLNQCWQIIT